MPRANPEVRKSLYVSAIGGTESCTNTPYLAFGVTEKESYRRTYTSHNSPGYPRVKLLNPYHMKMRRIVPGSKYSLVRKWVDACGINHTDYQQGDTVDATQVIYDDYYWDDYIATACNIADNNLRGQLKASGGNWGQNLATYKQLENLTVSTLRRLTRFLKALRSGDVGGMSNALALRERDLKKGKNIGDLSDLNRVPEFFLEVQYAWKPLYNDVYDAFNRARDSLKGIEHMVYGKGKKRSGDVRIKDPQPWIGWIYMDGWWVRVTCRAKTTVWFGVKNSELDQFKSYGLTNPLQVIWDIIPYSFIVDWFYPIGQVLDSLDACYGLEFHSGFRSYINETIAWGKYRGNPGIEGTVDDLIVQTIEVDRTVLTDFPNAHLPVFKSPLKPLHVAQALALFSQSLFGRRR